MRRFATFLLLCAALGTMVSQRPLSSQGPERPAPSGGAISTTPVDAALPDTSIDYEISVELTPATRMLSGRETVRWTNPSQSQAITRVPLHLYLNGFAHEGTTWMRPDPHPFDVRGVLATHADPWGWSEPRSIRQEGTTLEWRPISPDDGNPLDRSLIEVALQRPIGPGETLLLEIEFEARLPVPIARTGGFADFFVVGQWFPKIAAYETAGVRGAAADGWNAHQFHALTEFYANYADFDVQIGVPSGWDVAATGRRASEETRDGRVWRRYRQRAVHDFAFATGSAMTTIVSRHDPAGDGGPVEIHQFIPRHRTGAAPRWARAIEGALDVLGTRVGAYPYETITVVQPPFTMNRTGGMEYPTLFTGAFDDTLWDVGIVGGLRANEFVIAHEFAHQYFYGLIGSNEFEEAYLDEGFAEFWGDEATVATYGDVGEFLGRRLDLWEAERGYSTLEPSAEAVPIWTRPSYALTDPNAFDRIYLRSALTLKSLERRVGRPVLDRIFSTYFARWRFRHPRFEDFIDVAREVGGAPAAEFLLEAYRQAAVPDYRIADFEVARWSPPDGRVVSGDAVIGPDDPRPGAQDLTGLLPDAADDGVRVVAERVDVAAQGGIMDGIARITLDARRERPEADWTRETDAYYTSDVTLAGASWQHLPVGVMFRFADGVVVSDTWDGRSAYRRYRFLRSAPLAEARIDPDGTNLLDRDVVNNGRLLNPDRRLSTDWGAWVGGLTTFIAEAVTTWL